MEPPTLLLFVEDEGLISMVLEDVLREAGFEVIVVRTGQQVLSELQARVDELQGVVTDIRLGPGPTGWDIARRARELVPDLPVVYVSGDSAHEWSARGMPGSLMVQKPCVSAQVVTAVANLLNAADGSSPG